MLTGINIAETREYVSKLDQDTNNPTIFELGTLDAFVRSYIEKQTNQVGISSDTPEDQAKISFSLLERNILVVRLGLKGLKNFQDPQTKEPVHFQTSSLPIGRMNYQAVSDRVMKLFPANLINELADEILKDNYLSEVEEKN